MEGHPGSHLEDVGSNPTTPTNMQVWYATALAYDRATRKHAHRYMVMLQQGVDRTIASRKYHRAINPWLHLRDLIRRHCESI